MKRTYQSDRPRGELLRDVAFAFKHHGSGSREYSRAYMRWYRAVHPDLRAADLERLMEYRRAVALATGATNMAEYAAIALRGHDLVCWCPLDQPCHADVLLELVG